MAASQLLNRKNSFIKGFSYKTQTVVGRITQHSTGRQKQARFYQLANYWLKKVLISKENPFLLLPPVSLALFALISFVLSYAVFIHRQTRKCISSRNIMSKLTFLA